MPVVIFMQPINTFMQPINGLMQAATSLRLSRSVVWDLHCNRGETMPKQHYVTFLVQSHCVAINQINYYVSCGSHQLDCSRSPKMHCTIALVSEDPARGTVGVGVCRIQVDCMSPAHCTSTCIQISMVKESVH